MIFTKGKNNFSGKLKRTKFIRSKSGQIALPALLVIPTLLLFIYLLFETAKLSREKIRHQFALDSALFIELTNHSDYLNRTAYVNGAFPHRIFKEAFDCPPEENKIDRSDPDPDVDYECLYDVLYEMGAYPKMTNDAGSSSNDKIPVWEFEFAERRVEEDDYADLNDKDPDVPYQFELLQQEKAQKLWLRRSTMKIIVRIYHQIYKLLGDVQKAQMDIYQRLTSNTSFLRKSYYLNSGSCASGSCGQEAASAIMPYKLDTQLQHMEAIIYFVKGDEIDPTQTAYPVQKIRFPCTDCPSLDLFQLSVIKGNFSGLNRGITAYQPFVLGSNYFNVSLTNLRPRVRSTVSIVHPIGSDLQKAIWPFATPKFRVKMKP